MNGFKLSEFKKIMIENCKVENGPTKIIYSTGIE